ncbi:MAG TPA: Hpt domain-containing protein [Solirubrobacteraceae bacterium]|jgi:chemotaxis protein histidine kinase CheA|nr:Hpt domain-containing protein [Solirubrobacteraceae bacterium]
MNATLQTVWSEHEALVLERIAMVERALGELIAGRLSEHECEQARRAAHMLAGSVGMFGFERSSRAALALERALEEHATPDAARAQWLREQLAIMRAEGLEPPRA